MKRSLSPRDLADAIGASESSLRRWADDGVIQVSRTAGGHRRIAVSEAIRFIREAKISVAKPEKLGLPKLDQVPDSGRDGAAAPEEVLFDKLVAGDVQTVKGLLISWYLQGQSVASICDGPLRQAMARVGQIWKHDVKGIYQEHRATDVCMRSLSAWHEAFDPPSVDAPVAVGGAPSGDPYSIPSLMAATVLAEIGFRETNLGPNTPAEAMIHAVRDRDATLAWLSVSSPTEPDRLSREIERLGDTLIQQGASLVVGGRVTEGWKPPRRQGIHLVHSMVELAAFAQGVHASLGQRLARDGSHD